MFFARTGTGVSLGQLVQKGKDRRYFHSHYTCVYYCVPTEVLCPYEETEGKEKHNHRIPHSQPFSNRSDR